MIFQSAEIDSGLSSDRRIDRRKNGGRYRNKTYPSLINRSRKSGNVADYTSSESDKNVGTCEMIVSKKFKYPKDRCGSFVFFSAGKNKAENLSACTPKRSQGFFKVQRSYIFIGYNAIFCVAGGPGERSQ